MLILITFSDVDGVLVSVTAHYYLKKKNVIIEQTLKPPKRVGTSARQASKLFSITRKTMERRLKTDNGLMGPSYILCLDNDERVVRHVKKK